MSNVIGSDGLSGCFRCFFVWHPSAPDTARCPRCKSKLWDVPKLGKVRRGGGLGVEQVIGPYRNEIRRVLRRNRARGAMIFGSVARGVATESSDVDFLVEFSPGASAFDQAGLVEDLEALLGRKVDVTTRSGLHWIIRPQVLIEAIPI